MAKRIFGGFITGIAAGVFGYIGKIGYTCWTNYIRNLDVLYYNIIFDMQILRNIGREERIRIIREQIDKLYGEYEGDTL